MKYLWWGCRRNLTLITLGSGRVNIMQQSSAMSCPMLHPFGEGFICLSLRRRKRRYYRFNFHINFELTGSRLSENSKTKLRCRILTSLEIEIFLTFWSRTEASFVLLLTKFPLIDPSHSVPQMALPSNFTTPDVTNATPTAAAQSRQPAPDWYWAISGTLSVLTALDNGLVIYLITTRRSLHVTGNWFILSLAFADFFCGFLLQPLSFICYFRYSCNRKILNVFFNMFMSVSVFNTFMMTLDRYLSIVYPLKYASLMNTTRVVISVSTSWILPIILALLPLTWASESRPATADQVHTASMLVLIEFLLPVVLLAMYFRLLLTVRGHRRRTAIQLAQLSFNKMTVPRARPKNPDRSIKVIGTVVILFELCYALDIYKSICWWFRVCQVPYETRLASTLLVYFNSAINPLVYALFKRDIRHALKKLFRLTGLRREVAVGMTTRNEMTDMDYSYTIGWCGSRAEMPGKSTRYNS